MKYNYAVLLLLVLFPGFALALDSIPAWSSWSDKGIVLRPGSGDAWDNKEVMASGIVKRGDTYFLYYVGAKKSCNCLQSNFDNAHSAIGVATSKDGVNFTKYSGNPIARHEMDSKSEEDGIRDGFVRFDTKSNQFVMYYGGENTHSPGSTEVDARIYYRTSQDGLNWSGEKSTSGLGSSGEIYPDGIVWANGKYHFWWHYAEGPTGEASGQQTYYATGSSLSSFNTVGKVAGLNFGWTRVNPWLHDDGNTLSIIHFFCSRSRCDSNTRIASSKLSDPLKTSMASWTPNNFMLRPAILKDGTTWRMYAMNHKDPSGIRYWTAPGSGSSFNDGTGPSASAGGGTTTTAGACNLYASGAAPLQGYGAAWNPLTNGKELLLSGYCNTDGSVKYTVGSKASSPVQYVYKMGYYYTSSWQPFTMTGTFVQNSDAWLDGQGTYTNANAPATDYFWVGYVCHWTGTAWKCGCRDAACAQNFWQLQGVDR